MKVKYALEFIVCSFSGHYFIVSPEYDQQLDCYRCHQPYAETLWDKWKWLRRKRVEKRRCAILE